MRPYDVVTIGDICVDLVLAGPDVTPQFGQVEKIVADYRLEMGGSTCIFACQAAKLGLRTAVLGVAGDDIFGHWCCERMAAQGVDTSWVGVSPAIRTGLGLALVQSGDRAILTYPGSIDTVSEGEIPDEFLSSARHLHIGSFYLMTRLHDGMMRLIERAKRLGLSISLDPNWDPANHWDGGLTDILPRLDIFLPNTGELLALMREKSDEKAALRRLGALTPFIALKRGAAGAWLLRRECAMECTIQPVAEADSIGAGDAFDAGVVYGYLHRWPDDQTLKLACACGAASVAAQGGVAGQADYGRAVKALADPVLRMVTKRLEL